MLEQRLHNHTGSLQYRLDLNYIIFMTCFLCRLYIILGQPNQSCTGICHQVLNCVVGIKTDNDPEVSKATYSTCSLV